MAGPSFFQFNLRTAFIALTLACLFFGYEIDWIRQRRQFIRTRTNSQYEYEHSKEPPVKTYPPSALWIFGERGMSSLLVHIPFDETRADEFVGRVVKENHPRLKQAERLFPEATLTPFTISSNPQKAIPLAIKK
jgi:hypothetical protein